MAVAVNLAIAYDASPSAVTAVRVATELFPGAQASIVTVPAPAPRPLRGASRFLMNVPAGTVEQALAEVEEQTTEEARGIAARGVEQAVGLDAAPLVTRPHENAWEALLEAADGADALVCGARARSEFVRTVLGSTSTRLLHHADRPLVVVPDDVQDTPAAGPIVIAYDGSPAADRAIDVASHLLSGRPALVVHVYDSQYRDSLAVRALARGEVGDIVTALDQALTDEATAVTEQGVARARAAGLDASGETIEADQGVWRTIAALVRERGAALVATGSRGNGGARSVLLGSVSSGLVYNADAPVLVAPSPD